MIMFKKKLATLAMGIIVTSAITVGSMTPVSAMESQHNFNDNAGTKTQCTVMKDSFSNRYAAAQFTFNDDGEKVLTVTPKANFRSHNRNFKKGAYEAPVVVVETPVVDEDSVIVDETLVVDEDSVIVDETPVVDEDSVIVD
jgi:uncharacterized protein with FMN-binding domain